MQNSIMFAELLAEAKVTRADIALDIEGIRPDDCLWDLQKAIYRETITKAGELGTLYFGNRHARKRLLRIYDKGAEMGKPELKLTRIEREYKSNKLRLSELSKLPNVFSTLKCYDVYAALAGLDVLGVPPMYRRFLHDSCCCRGLRFALRQLESLKLRKAIEQAIHSSVPAFWDAKAIWSEWPAAVAQAFSEAPLPHSGEIGAPPGSKVNSSTPPPSPPAPASHPA
jgi:hypothetical protein